jgi:hypothetical protein
LQRRFPKNLTLLEHDLNFVNAKFGNIFDMGQQKDEQIES